MSDLTTRLLDEINRHAEYPDETVRRICPECGELAESVVVDERIMRGWDDHLIKPRVDRVTTTMHHADGRVCELVAYPPDYTKYRMHVDRGQPVLPPPWAALKAIVELHESRLRMVGGGSLPYCRECGSGPTCATVKAIATALGVDA